MVMLTPFGWQLNRADLPGETETVVTTNGGEFIDSFVEEIRWMTETDSSALFSRYWTP